MMLRHVASLLGRPWAITPDGFHTVCSIIDRRANGIRLDSDEIKALIAESKAEFEARHAAAFGRQQEGGSLAVICLYGTITPRPVMQVSGGGGAPLSKFMELFRQADQDPNVKAILLDIDSPGGSVEMVPEAAALIRNAKTPVTAIANTMAGSAAYHLASQANEISVSPSGMVGSIGVFARHVDESGALEQEGLKVTLISAGAYKTEGNPYEPLSDDARAAIQATVNEFYDVFVNDVARGRGVSPEEVVAGFGQGRMLTAQRALAAGMVDRVETFDEAVARLLAGTVTRPGYAATATGLSSPVVSFIDERWLLAAPVPADPAPDDPEDDLDDDTIDPDDIAAPDGDNDDDDKDSPVQPEERPSGADKPANEAPGLVAQVLTHGR